MHISIKKHKRLHFFFVSEVGKCCFITLYEFLTKNCIIAVFSSKSANLLHLECNKIYQFAFCYFELVYPFLFSISTTFSFCSP